MSTSSYNIIVYNHKIVHLIIIFDMKQYSEITFHYDFYKSLGKRFFIVVPVPGFTC